MRVQFTYKTDDHIEGYLNIPADNNVEQQVSFGEAEEVVINECIFSKEHLKYLAQFVELTGRLIIIDQDIGLISDKFLSGKLTTEDVHNIQKIPGQSQLVLRPLYLPNQLREMLPNFSLKKQRYDGTRFILELQRNS